MKIQLAQYARLLLTALSMSVFAACGGGGGGSDSDVSAPSPTADITDIVDDRASPGVSVPANGSTTDTSPMVKGTVSQVLGACGTVNPCYRVQVFEGSTALGNATVSGKAWTFSNTFAVGTHTLTAVVVRFDGARGAISTARSFSITVAATGKLPHSGITVSQCYAAGGSALLACNQPGALALSGQQDGYRASINPMSYSQVGSYPITSCVKDNVTGLIWEGKEASGTRAGSNTYTHYDSTSSNQYRNGSTYVPPTQAQIDAGSNSIGYVNYVNSMALCGYTDWRLPTVDELHSIVDYSKTYPGPSVDPTWFPNTPSSWNWSSSPDVSLSSYAWYVFFLDGSVSIHYRDEGLAVRLVRASQ